MKANKDAIREYFKKYMWKLTQIEDRNGNSYHKLYSYLKSVTIYIIK